MKLLRRFLILSHRYLGIVLSALIVMWFATGITMMYVGGMPRLTPELRLERMPGLDLSRVHLTPAEAAERGLVDPSAGRVAVLSVMDRPAYRFGEREAVTVFADNGEVLEEVTLDQARTIASRFMNLPEDRIHLLGTITEVDQWTLLQGRQLPLHKFSVDDDAATELYVSPQTGEVSVLTTRRSRGFAWISTIPHWLYFTALRTNQAAWYNTVVYGAALACVLAVLGLVLGVTQWRRQKPLAASIPYSGWMRWHYITGVVFGVFTLTWAFSGMLSMEPFAWTNARGLEVERDVFTGGALDLSRFSAMDQATWNRVLGGRAIKEMDLARIQDEHYYVVRAGAATPTAEGDRERLHQPYNVTGRAESDRLLVSASTLEIRRQPFSADSLVTRLRTALPDAPIAEQQLLTEYDSYYYSKARQTPLPVLRVKFNDPAQTWVYIDPGMSQVLAQIHRLNRVERWLYNGLHSLDFAFWYNSPAWDVVMILLCLGGLASSGIGLMLGMRRLRRGAVRTAGWMGSASDGDDRRLISRPSGS